MTDSAPNRNAREAPPEPHGVCRRAVRVRGVVQGVGFRPFVFRIATEEGLAGSIGNDTEGVTIEVEGPADRIETFLLRLRSEIPPLARIDAVAVQELPCTRESGFRIVSSEVKGRVSTGIPADAATCSDCLRELFDPADRRYRYPFLNCTNCGPRFTITRRIPYDRPQTSMATFGMCSACQAEYDDPLSRRFHAQPNACPVCGPRVWLEEPHSAKGSLHRPMGSIEEAVGASELGAPGLACETWERYPHFGSVAGHEFTRAENARTKKRDLAPAEDPIAATIERLLAGQILAIKGIGGFHLAVDATNESAVRRLRERKHRYGKPLAVMVRDLNAARSFCELGTEEESLLQTPARPIVLVRARQNTSIAASVAPGIPWLGIFLPYAPLQHLLFADPRVHALVMTSANLSEEPIAIDNDEARARLGNIADAFLLHDREILQRCDDSVVAVVDGVPQLMRRARGYVPLGVPFPFDAPPLLAVGGNLKNVFTLARGSVAYQSQHLGDLENLTGLDFFRHSLDHLVRTFEIEPEFIAHDLHPGYLSTSWAKDWGAERGLPLIGVQHHHAHIAACMAEHALTGPLIGLSLDGTGYGADGTIWGGEVLIAQLDRFARFAYLVPVPMPGGDAAVRAPWRMAFAHLRAAGLTLEDSARLTGATAEEGRVLDRMIEKGINAPPTSSLGRLFDAVAAIVLNRREVDYDAQAAIELEGLALDEPDRLPGYSSEFLNQKSCHPEPRALEAPIEQGALGVSAAKDLLLGYDIEPCAERQKALQGAPIRIDPSPLWHELLADLRAGKPAPHIAARFHAGVAGAYVEAARRARAASKIHQVVLSGGCLHNRRLARLLRADLENVGFEVFQHRNVSPGDGGLSYGQVVVSAALLAHRRTAANVTS